MDLTLDRRLVPGADHAGARLRREANVPSAKPQGLFARLVAMPPLDEEEDVVPRVVELLPYVAAWG